MGSGSGDAMEPSDINEKTQIVGRQIWRVVPYAKRYPGRVVAGILGNAMARFFDLMPFVAIGLAVDYFTGSDFVGPHIVEDFVTSFGGDPAIGYGILIFLAFSSWQFFKESLNIPGKRLVTRFNTIYEWMPQSRSSPWRLPTTICGKRGRSWLCCQVT